VAFDHKELSLLSKSVRETMARVAETMAGYPARWVLCGGWAVDAWLGGETRDHGDIDIGVFLDDSQTLNDHLAGWELVHHDAFKETNELWDGKPIQLPGHLHARIARPEDAIAVDGALWPEQGFEWDFVFNEGTDDDQWVLYFTPADGKAPSREPVVTIPFYRGIDASRFGVPTMTPEALLFYKATSYKGSRNYLRRRDHLDFERLLPRLSRDQRSWLGEAIATVEADHPWLGVIAM
jgi:hypothetical protein